MSLSREVLVAVLNVNSTSFIGGTQVHLKSFRESLGIADALLSPLAAGAGALKMFVAPEYFFSQKVEMPRNVGPGTKTGYMPVSREQGRKLIQDLIDLSSQYPDFLIVAGSIHYMQGVGKKTTYNVCPILSAGALVHLYHKKAYDHFAGDVLTNPDFFNGSESPLFDFDGVSFGVEICLDHGRRALENHVSSSGSAAPQIQVLVSRGMRLGRITATELAIHCDMSPGVPNAGTVKQADGTAIDSVLTSRPVSDGSYLECFHVPARRWVMPAPPVGGAPAARPMMGTGRTRR